MTRWELLHAVVCFLFFFAVTPQANSQTLGLVPTAGWDASSEILSLDITLNAQGGTQPSAVEWTVGFPVAELESVIAGPSGAGKALQCSGKYALVRCVLAGANSDSVVDGVIATVRLRALALSGFTAPAMLSNIVASSAAGDALPFQGEGSAITLPAPYPLPTPPGAVFKTGSMAHVVTGGVWKTTITLLNTGSTPAVAQLDFYDNAGQPLPIPLSYPQYPVMMSAPVLGATLSQMLEPGAVMVLETSPVNVANLLEGWAKLVTAGNIEGYVVITNLATHQEAAVPMRRGDPRPQFLAFDNTSGKRTGFALANLSTAPVSVTTVVRDGPSGLLANGSIDLAPLGHTSVMLDTLYPATLDKRGTLEFYSASGDPVDAIGLRVNGQAITTLPLLSSGSPAFSAGLPASIAHLAIMGGWSTSLTIVNSTNANADPALNFFDPSGNPLPLTLSDAQTGAIFSQVPGLVQTLPSGSSLWIDSQQTPEALIVGSATLTGDVSGFAILGLHATGQEAVVPLEARSASSYWLTYDNTNSMATGFALANSTAVGGYVRLTFRDEAGALLGTSDSIVEPYGHASFVLADRFGITAGRRGTIEAAPPPGGNISMIGLRFTPAGTFTTLPILETRH